MSEVTQSVKNPLESENIGKLIAKFAIPSVVSMLVNALYNIVDQIFIGNKMGYLGNGAANVVLLVSLVSLSISLLLGDGTAASISLHLGAKQREKAEKSFGNMIVLLLVFSLLILAVGIFFLEPILRLFGATDVLLPYAKEYGFIILLGLPFLLISTSLNSIIRVDGSPRYAMASMMIGSVINGCLDPVFIYLFDWGLKGAAVATYIGQLVSFLISLLYFRHCKELRLTRKLFRPQLKVMQKICTLGISSFIDQIAFTFVMAVNNNLIVHYGFQSVYGSEIPLTAYGISMKVQEILFTLLLGLAIGMQPIVGYNYGAKNLPRVKKTFLITLLIGSILSILATVLFVFSPEPIIRLFGSADQSAYFEFAKHFFKTYFLFYIFFGVITITGVFFQAIGKPRQAAFLSFSYQFMKILAALLLCRIIGLDGVLYSGPVSDALAFLLSALLILLTFKKWKKVMPGNQAQIKL